MSVIVEKKVQGVLLVIEFTDRGDAILRTDMMSDPEEVESQLALVELGFNHPPWYREFERIESTAIVMMFTEGVLNPREMCLLALRASLYTAKNTGAFSQRQGEEKIFVDFVGRAQALVETTPALYPKDEDEDEDEDEDDFGMSELDFDESEGQTNEDLRVAEAAEELNELYRDFRYWAIELIEQEEGGCPRLDVTNVLQGAIEAIGYRWYPNDEHLDYTAGISLYSNLVKGMTISFYEALGNKTELREVLSGQRKRWLIGQAVQLVEEEL